MVPLKVNVMKKKTEQEGLEADCSRVREILELSKQNAMRDLHKTELGK